MSYDPANIFARILRGEIPCRKVHESAHALAFEDINPLTPKHVLVIPKGAYVNLDDFSANASAEEMADFVKALGETARIAGIAESAGGNGFRLIANNGVDAHQEVPHFHVHIVGGTRLGGMLPRRKDA